MQTIDEVTEQEVFDFLDELRESGVTNMFGAPAYLQAEFGFDKNEAIERFVKWTEQFKR